MSLNPLFRRTLVIAPHSDDETLSCGGLLHRISRLNNLPGLLRKSDEFKSKVVVVSAGSIYFDHLGREVTFQERKSELSDAMDRLGVKDWILWREGLESMMDTHPLKLFVSAIDGWISEFKPTCVLYPYPSHHQDHQVLSRATEASLRTDPNSSVELAAMYEYPYLGSHFSGSLPSSKFYVSLDEEDLEAKIEALSMHKSQMARDNRHPISLDSVRSWSLMRGREVGRHAAETFHCLRVVS